MINIDIDHFRARILQDALTEATAQYWIHRAHQFQQAAPRLDEYHGQATRDELNQALDTTAWPPREPASAMPTYLAANTPNRSAPRCLDVLAEVA